MDSEHTFARDETYPSWFVNALSKFLSVGAFGLQLVRQDATHVQIQASAGVGGVAAAIQGRWRWVEANLSAAHPGGGAGTYDIFLTAADTQIVSTPDPFTDDTNYAFGLQIKASGSTPTIVAGTVDIYRKVGSLQWDGAQITRIDQTVPTTPLHGHRHATGQPDAIAPGDIGAATPAYVDAETARAEAAEAAETARAETAEALAVAGFTSASVGAAKAANFTAAPGKMNYCSAALIGTLPNAPVDDSECGFSADGGNVTIARGGADTIIDDGATVTQLKVPKGMAIVLKYIGGVWHTVRDSRGRQRVLA